MNVNSETRVTKCARESLVTLRALGVLLNELVATSGSSSRNPQGKYLGVTIAIWVPKIFEHGERYGEVGAECILLPQSTLHMPLPREKEAGLWRTGAGCTRSSSPKNWPRWANSSTPAAPSSWKRSASSIRAEVVLKRSPVTDNARHSTRQHRQCSNTEPKCPCIDIEG